MAGFTCQICGGSIKMQANQTGICQQCGMEYDIDAIRAMADVDLKRGAQTVPTPASKSVCTPANDDISRDALLAYLGDLRVIETIIRNNQHTFQRVSYSGKKNNDEVAKAQNTIQEIKKEEKSDTWGTWTSVPEMPEFPKRLIIKTIVLLACGGLLIALSFLLTESINSLGFLIMLLVLGSVIGFVGIINMLFLLLTLTMGYPQGKKDYERYCAEKETRTRELELKMESAKQMLDKVNVTCKTKRDEISRQLNALSIERNNYSMLLKKAYSANIIPVQFRNIEGVYYLYDYLSTSNQSLSEALMQANLEVIKKKLDNIIHLQSAQIIEQRIINAKLGQVLKYSEATMNNTAVAAKYAQIAAINSELNVKLSEKQLAYQMAEFWLK